MYNYTLYILIGLFFLAKKVVSGVGSITTSSTVLSLLVSADTTLIVRVFLNVLNVLKHVNDTLAKTYNHTRKISNNHNKSM